MRSVSLRWRGVASSLAVLAVLLAAVYVFVDANLGRQLRADQRSRLVALAALGAASAPGLSDQALADRVTVGEVTVTVTSAGGVPVVGVARRGGRATALVLHRRRRALLAQAAAGGVRVVERRSQLVVSEDVSGSRTLTLLADRDTIDSAQRRFRLLMLLASAGGLLAAGLALWWVLGRALAPLDVMTATARAIAAGDRGRRLAPDRDDTELGRAATAVDAMLEELEGAEREAAAAREQLARFLSDASHELRTPLAGISAGAERLLTGDDDREARERLAAQVVREARRAARLVDDLLTASRSEDLVSEQRDVDVRALARSAAARARARSTRPGGAVEVVDQLDGAPAVVAGDRGRLEQVLANLLDNALRAAGSGPVRVRLAPAPAPGPAGGPGPAEGPAARAVTRPADGPAAVVVVVSDGGPGVAPADRERVFERLVRLDDARTRSTGGAGLGLAIARGIAVAHGGTLVCGDPGPDDLPGAAFTVGLPLHPSVPLPAPHSPRPPPPPR